MTLFFTKELFVQTLAALEQQYQKDETYCEQMKNIVKIDGIMHPYDNHLLTNQLLTLLQKQFPPMGAFCDIEYFINDLEFGKKDGEIYRDFRTGEEKEGGLYVNSKRVDLSSAEKLWDYLTSKKNTDK